MLKSYYGWDNGTKPTLSQNIVTYDTCDVCPNPGYDFVIGCCDFDVRLENADTLSYL